MDKWQRTWLVCRNTWIESVSKLQFFASLLFSVIICCLLRYEVFEKLYLSVGKISIPELIINTINSSYIYLVIICGLFIFLMQAPYFTRADALLLPRLGRGPWIWGKILFVAGFALLTVVLIYAFTILLALPFADLTRWSWKDEYVVFLGEQMERTVPWQILIQSFGLNYLFLLLMAFIAMLLNLCYSRVIALVVAGSICASSTIIDVIFPQLARFGLALHASIRYHSFHGIDNIAVGAPNMLPTVPESLLLFAAGCVLCLILIRYRVRNYDFQLESKGMH